MTSLRRCCSGLARYSSSPPRWWKTEEKQVNEYERKSHGARIHEILECVQRLAGVRAIFRLDRRRDPRCGLFTADYLVNLKKNDQPFLDRVADFDAALRKVLVDGEELRYENLSFVHYEMSHYFRAEVESRMLDDDWVKSYPNPADRFVFICRRMRNYENNPQLRDLRLLGVSVVQ